jgi:hypothetical protein
VGRGFEVQGHTSSPTPPCLIGKGFRAIHRERQFNRRGIRGNPLPISAIEQIDCFDSFLPVEVRIAHRHLDRLMFEHFLDLRPCTPAWISVEPTRCRRCASQICILVAVSIMYRTPSGSSCSLSHVDAGTTAMKIMLPNDCRDHRGNLRPTHHRRLNGVRVISLGLTDQPQVDQG